MLSCDFLILLAICDVTHRTDDHNTFFSFDRTEIDIRREFASILTKCYKFGARTHGASVRLSSKSIAVSVVLLSKPLGNENFKSLVEKFVSLVAEQFLGLRVNEDNLPVRINNDHRIGRGIQKIAERPFHTRPILLRAREYANSNETNELTLTEGNYFILHSLQSSDKWYIRDAHCP